jgi:D-inositol-3-phosphate glycosyltransferase
MDRVAKALVISTPEVEEVQCEEDADFVLIHAIGFPETAEAVARCLNRKQKYGIAQYCLRTTQESNTLKWMAIWDCATVVWSYYDLPALCAEDGYTFKGNFYKSPLGVDTNVFYPRGGIFGFARNIAIATSGYVFETEAVTEAHAACEALNRDMFHLGPNNGYGHPMIHVIDITDEQLAVWYSKCEYVAGLRRIEGFELPAAEGLLCGARPIMFDRPHYRNWFGNFAEFIPEGSRTDVAASLVRVLATPARPVTEAERKAAASLFHWPTIARGFWSATGLVAPPISRPRAAQPVHTPSKPRLLYVGDVAVSSGFARAAERGILAEVHKHYEVIALGINYLGDPHDLPYRVYPCHDYHGGDAFGTYRLPKLAAKIKPDVIVIQQDPWNFPAYFEGLKAAKLNIPVIGSVAVDGKNCRGRALRDVAHAAFWTEFGRNEAINGGYDGPTTVIPLGVDLDIYQPRNKAESRKRCGLKGKHADGFIVGNVNRNQPRKRLDLTIKYFAEWIKKHKVNDAYLLFHVAPTGDQGYDIEQLMDYYGVFDRLILSKPEIGKGVEETQLCDLYNAFDVQVSTTQGEGWGLTTMEGMACGVPQIVPDWSALGEWTGDTVYKVDCIRETIVTPSNINAIGGVPSAPDFVEALHEIYIDLSLRAALSKAGLALVSRPEFRWEAIAKQWLQLVDNFLAVCQNSVAV